MLIAEFLSIVNIGTPALLAFVAFNMTTIPCFATVAAAKGELYNKKRFNFTLIFWVLVSYITASALYLVGTYPLLLIAYLIVAVLVFALIFIKNNKQRNKKLKGE